MQGDQFSHYSLVYGGHCQVIDRKVDLQDKDDEDPEEPESQTVGRGVERTTLASVVSKDDIADAVSEAVSKNIVKLFSNDQEFRSEGDNLSKIIVKRTVEHLKQKEATNKATAEAENFWYEDDVTGVIFCVVCRNHSERNLDSVRVI